MYTAWSNIVCSVQKGEKQLLDSNQIPKVQMNHYAATREGYKGEKEEIMYK